LFETDAGARFFESRREGPISQNGILARNFTIAQLLTLVAIAHHVNSTEFDARGGQ
jgi:hypothetical protein